MECPLYYYLNKINDPSCTTYEHTVNHEQFKEYFGQKEMEIIVKILENCWNVSAKNLMAFKLNPFWIRFILWWYDEEIAMEGIGTAGKIMCFCIFRILSRLRNSTNTCFVFIKSERRENRPVLISHMVAIWSLKFAVS